MPRMQPFTDFTRKLGFDGYSDFKSYLKFESNKTHQLPSNSIDSFKQEIDSTFSYLERVDYQLLTEKMHTASTIYLYGTGRAQLNVASEAQRILLTLHNHVIVLHDLNTVQKRFFEQRVNLMIYSLLFHYQVKHMNY